MPELDLLFFFSIRPVLLLRSLCYLLLLLSVHVERMWLYTHVGAAFFKLCHGCPTLPLALHEWLLEKKKKVVASCFSGCSQPMSNCRWMQYLEWVDALSDHPFLVLVEICWCFHPGETKAGARPIPPHHLHSLDRYILWTQLWRNSGFIYFCLHNTKGIGCMKS